MIKCASKNLKNNLNKFIISYIFLKINIFINSYFVILTYFRKSYKLYINFTNFEMLKYNYLSIGLIVFISIK
jgi:hypothetical protein